MKRVIILCIAFLTGCAPVVSPQMQSDLKESTMTVKRLQMEQEKKFKNNAPPEEVYGMIETARANEDYIGELCNKSRLTRSLYQWCIGHRQLTAPLIAQMELTAARSYAASGAKNTAKDMYRNIVLSYPEPYWKSLRQAAEYGLQDLEKQ